MGKCKMNGKMVLQIFAVREAAAQGRGRGDVRRGAQF